MAERRMFAKTIIDSDAFLDMPITARLLYYDLSMRADDDGFLNNPKKILRIIGCSEKDLKTLTDENFIIPFESGVVVIKHWKIHNYIRNDRYKETVYKEEKALLETKENKVYTLGIPNGYQMDTQVRIGKDKLGKDNNILSTSDNADSQKNNINFQNIVDIYNSICISLPKVIKLTEARKKSIKSAAELIGSEEDFKQFFKKIESSDFLCGRTENPWTGCGFDWILKKSNLIKILEGNYNNQSKSKNNKPDYYDTSRYENLNFD